MISDASTLNPVARRRKSLLGHVTGRPHNSSPCINRRWERILTDGIRFRSHSTKCKGSIWFQPSKKMGSVWVRFLYSLFWVRFGSTTVRRFDGFKHL